MNRSGKKMMQPVRLGFGLYVDPFTNSGGQTMKTSNSRNQSVEIARKLCHLILTEIPGSKIVTVTTNREPQAFDLSKKGRIGYEPEHKNLFIDLLAEGISSHGAVIIREFLPFKLERNINGKKVMIPKKNIYALTLGQGIYIKIDARVVRDSFGYDHQTGAPLPPEQDCYYKNLPF